MLVVQDAPNAIDGNTFTGAVLQIGVDDPVGDAPIRFAVRVTENVFTDGAFLAVRGGDVLGEAEFLNNRTESGSCYMDYRQRLSCNNDAHRVDREMGDACYGSPRKIEGAVCL
jgi:hypothetical protein